MIIAIGSDFIEVERIRLTLERQGKQFLRRVFTDVEQAYCLSKQDPVPHLAARFAAKEAFQKTWGAPHRWQDVWVEHDENSWGRRPMLRFSPTISALMDERRWHAHVTLSHTHSAALAVVVLETLEDALTR